MVSGFIRNSKKAFELGKGKLFEPEEVAPNYQTMTLALNRAIYEPYQII